MRSLDDIAEEHGLDLTNTFDYGIACDLWIEELSVDNAKTNARRIPWLRACKPSYFNRDKRLKWYDAYTWQVYGVIYPGKSWPVIVFFEWWWM